MKGENIQKGWAVLSIGIVIGITLLAVNLANVFAQPSPESKPVTDGLVSWWTFDEGSGNIAHDSQSKNHGEIYGAEWAKGKVGNALLFDGVEFKDYVKIPHSQGLNITDAITVSARFNVTTVTDGVEAIVMKRHGNWTGGPYNMSLYNTGFSGIIGTDEAAWNGLVANTWYHGAMTYDGSEIKVYLDGKLVGTKSCPGKIPESEQDLYIGACLEGGSDLPTWNFHGIIDEVRIYNRALSQKEILDNL